MIPPKSSIGWQKVYWGKGYLANVTPKQFTLPHLGDESRKLHHPSPTLGQPSTFTNTSAPEDQVWLRDRRVHRGILNKA